MKSKRKKGVKEGWIAGAKRNQPKKLFDVHEVKDGTIEYEVRIIGRRCVYTFTQAQYETFSKRAGKDDLFFVFAVIEFHKIKGVKGLYRILKDSKRWWRTLKKPQKVEVTRIICNKSRLVRNAKCK